MIDPSLNIPEHLLAPLDDGEERKNMTLWNKHGSINAEAWLVGQDLQIYIASIDVQNRHGNTSLNLVRQDMIEKFTLLTFSLVAR